LGRLSGNLLATKTTRAHMILRVNGIGYTRCINLYIIIIMFTYTRYNDDVAHQILLLYYSIRIKNGIGPVEDGCNGNSEADMILRIIIIIIYIILYTTRENLCSVNRYNNIIYYYYYCRKRLPTFHCSREFNYDRTLSSFLPVNTIYQQ